MSNEKIYGSEKFDDAGGGSEMRIMEKINYYTSLDACRGPTIFG